MRRDRQDKANNHFWQFTCEGSKIDYLNTSHQYFTTVWYQVITPRRWEGKDASNVSLRVRTRVKVEPHTTFADFSNIFIIHLCTNVVY